MGDDGVGSYVVEQLSRHTIPQNVKIVNCGPDILKIMSYLDNQRLIILVDAIDAGEMPGTIFRYTKSDLMRLPGKSKSAHLLSAVESVRLLDEIDPVFREAELEFIGIQPARVGISEELSPAVKTAADRIIGDLSREYVAIR